MSTMSMGGARPRLRLAPLGRALAAVAGAVWLAALAPTRAGAFDFLDGRLQIHGDFEEQIRALSNDFSSWDNFDLAQWYNVLNVQTEYDFAPNGWGPFDVLKGYMRAEVRYDCVWTRACGLFPSVNTYGDRIERLPGVKTTGRQSGFFGTANEGDQWLYTSTPGLARQANIGRYTGQKYEPFVDPRTNDSASLPASKNLVNCDPATHASVPGSDRCRAVAVGVNPRSPAGIDQSTGFVGLFSIAGANQNFEANGRASVITVANPAFPSVPGAPPTVFTTLNDDPAYFYFSGQLKCKFGSRFFPGPADGEGDQLLGPLDPRCKIDPDGALHGKPNPFNSGDLNPILVNKTTGALIGGSGELPGRPASVALLGQSRAGAVSQGVSYPSGPYANFLHEHQNSSFDQNFTTDELAWNHGGSQQETHEFKEGYLDMEFFDSRLWVRAGKQNIVWGKTELFRTTDQFNPQDLALASLPSLEESRIALWSMRGVWSFYDVGPFEDMRLEVAANLDHFEPADIGRCGEPFTALVACNKTTALWAHGLAGFALAGEHRPDMWWDNLSGLDYGARLEFRYGRFSFQISDFYGYDSFPWVKQIDSFERNVDPTTGRPRVMGSRMPCITGNEPGCLPIESNYSINAFEFPSAVNIPQNYGGCTTAAACAFSNVTPALGTAASRSAVINGASANIQLFAMICATSIGFSSVDPTACGQSVFNSKINVLSVSTGSPTPCSITTPNNPRKNCPSVASLLSNLLAGNNNAAQIASLGFAAGTPIPFVALNADPCDGFLSNNQGGCTTTPGRGPTSTWAAKGQKTLNQVLTDEQEALLGCGPFWGTDCEADGIDLLNSEASVLMQSFIGFEGNYSAAYAKAHFIGWNYGGAMSGNLPQPGTVNFDGAPVAVHNERGQMIKIVGARGPNDPGYNPNVDGCAGPNNPYTGAPIPGCASAKQLGIPAKDLNGNPLQGGGFGASTGQLFVSEMAALSFNFQNLLVAFSQAPSEELAKPAALRQIEQTEFNPANPYDRSPGQCSFAQPQYCSSVKAFYVVAGVERNSVRAGGNGVFGRRDFVWDSGGEGVLEYQKRNVLGFSMDFAEDYTKSNWSLESTWIPHNHFTDDNSWVSDNQADTLNLTVSVDRPTFINFMNQNRTFFFNSQVFFQYITNYQSGFTTNGPFNMLGTFTIQTGYFQDRLLPSITFVHDIRSQSGAILPEVTYRFTENFSASIGTNFFYGHFQTATAPIAPLAPVGSQAGDMAYDIGTENALAVVRERDEAFLRIRYTF